MSKLFGCQFNKYSSTINAKGKPKAPEAPDSPNPPQPVTQEEGDTGYYWFGKNIMRNGIMYLMGEVEDDSVQPIIMAIMEYNLMSDADRPDKLVLFINSPGGFVSSAYHLIDTIKQSSIPVYTIGTGEVASAGVMLLMAGQKGKRFITENCSVMSHQFSRGVVGKEHEIAAAAKDFQLDSNRMLAHYRKCTGKTVTYIRKHLLQQSDCFFSPEDAVTHGIVDEVIKNP
jgi:ATP-dependent Clp protease protease subunit